VFTPVKTGILNQKTQEELQQQSEIYEKDSGIHLVTLNNKHIYCKRKKHNLIFELKTGIQKKLVAIWK
jgi:hypothetical protein